MKRLLYLDNLKVCLTVLVIFHHAGQAYGDGGEWNDFVAQWCAAQAYGAYIVHLLHQMLFLDRWIKKLI